MNHQGHGLLLYIISLIHSSCYKIIWGGGGGGCRSVVGGIELIWRRYSVCFN